MKPKFFFFAMLLMAFGTTAFAQNRKATEPLTAVRFAETFSTVTINDDMAVILTQGTLPEITIEGDAKAIAAKVADGHLYIEARNPAYAAGTKVYVPAGLLSKVFVNGNGTLHSASVLDHSKLKIFLAGEAKINVRSTGSVTVETLNDIQFVSPR